MNNWKTKAISGLLALAVLVPSAAFAADAINSTVDVTSKKGFANHQPFNQEKQQEFNDKLLALVTKYTPDSLEEWKTALAQQVQLREEMKAKQPADQQRPEMSDETKAKVKAIQEQVKSGTLTKEQAQEQLKALGIEGLRDKAGFKGQTKMSDEVKEKVTAIRENLKNGTITQEEAQEQLKALGIERPVDKDGLKDRPELSDEVKQKLDAIKADVESGKLTQEQAREEMKKLGLNPHPMAQFNEAVEANDEAKIKELLPQMLEQLQERNEALSNKLAESN